MKTHRSLAATKRLSLSAILSAIGVILLYVGSILDILSLTMVAIASLIVFFAVIELKGKYPLMIYGVTAFLSVLLLPEKTGPISYLLFGGIYPILKVYFEKLPKWLSYLLKFLSFNVMAALILWLTNLILHVPMEEGMLYMIALVFCANLAFLLLDFLMTQLTRLYYFKFRRLLGIEKYLNG